MTDLLEKDRESHQHAFAMRVARVLTDSLSGMPASRLEQLASARKTALRAQKAQAFTAQTVTSGVLVAAGGPNLGEPSRFGRVGMTAGVLVLVAACLVGIFHVEQQRRIDELADIDTALLDDDVPISTYADHGFNAYVKQNQ